MKYKLILCLVILSIFSAIVFASNAPPVLPMEIWGQATIDGNPADNGLNVEAIIDGQNYAQASVTQNDYYDVIITGLDSPLTYNDDPGCSSPAHNFSINSSATACISCIPCAGSNCLLGYNESTCIEGPQDGATVTIKIDGDESGQSFSLASGGVSNQDIIITVVITFTKDLVAGWNLFSLPMQPASTAIADVLNSIDGKYDIVWTTDNGVWQSNKDFFGALETITPDKSYRIYMNQAATLNVSGEEINYLVITAQPGWSLIGYPSLDTRNLDALLAGKDYGIIWTTDNGVWQSDKDFFGALEQFKLGYGYRIYANSLFTINVTN